jgi:hypothetical protein
VNCKHFCGVLKGFKEGFENCFVPRDYQSKTCDYVEDTQSDCKNLENSCSNPELRGCPF